MNDDSKYCEFCGNKVFNDSVMCPKCGRQLKVLKTDNNNPQIVINNIVHDKKQCDKWIAFLLCFFLGAFGIHKFYEGKTGLGVLYIFTLGLFGIGWLIDTIVILCKPNPYYV